MSEKFPERRFALNAAAQRLSRLPTERRLRAGAVLKTIGDEVTRTGKIGQGTERALAALPAEDRELVLEIATIAAQTSCE